MSYTSIRKQEILESVASGVAGSDGNEHEAEFVRRFFGRVPTAELADKPARDLAGLATEFLDFARRRVGGEIRFRVYNPNVDRHGWESTHTIVEIVNVDMPFLVDSVVLALSELGISAHLIIHPVMRVVRDPGGHLMKICADGDADEG